ncbi:unnamed protein product [Lactuca virosa]|uniref:BHLH domain-containing protein n=1 Tax=Lactuca virosa TaxID=75947 RepID=A0AAU9P2U4_9ASTR|nr:unnamed protein product [Lactuca virosa]
MMQSFNEFPSFMENNNKSSDEVNWLNHNGLIISDVGPFLSFPKEYELHTALEPAFMGSANDSFQNLSIGDDSKSKANGMVFYNENVENLLGNMNPCDVVKEEEKENSRGEKPSIVNKRRGKPGAKQKARPRDRQLIQDRLKDLRELVPDGAKCSIDGLLDRTVKHMLFLKKCW